MDLEAPLRSALLAASDEVHQWRIAQRTIDAFKKDGTTKRATGDLPI